MSETPGNGNGNAVRPIYRYEVPDDPEIRTVGLVALKMSEERLAAKRAPRNDGIKLAYELLAQSLVEVNGESVDVAGNAAGGSVYSWLEKMHAKTRSLVQEAWQLHNLATDEEKERFFGSEKVSV